MAQLNRREHKVVPGTPTEKDIKDMVSAYETSQEVRAELLSPKGYVTEYLHFDILNRMI